jgi:hypothetical protein
VEDFDVTTIRILTAAALLSAVPAAALAQGSEKAEEAKPVTRTELSAELDADYADMDGDKDGKVTPAEINARLVKSAEAKVEAIRKERDAAFARLDANGDGTISRAEFDEKAKLPTVKEPDAKPFLDRFDTDKDGAISKDEFRAPTLANFDRADKNKDGTVTPSERGSAPAATATTAKKAPTFKKTPPINR